MGVFDTFQTCTWSPSQTVTSRVPSGDSATTSHRLSWVLNGSPLGVPSAFQSRTMPPASVVTNRLPLEAKAAATTSVEALASRGFRAMFLTDHRLSQYPSVSF